MVGPPEGVEIPIGSTRCLTLVALMALDYQVLTREDASFVPLGLSELSTCFLMIDSEASQDANVSVLYASVEPEMSSKIPAH